MVKLLGDGALMKYPDAASALSGTFELVAAVGDAGLPSAHAGIAAGRVIVRDGDVFGRTVNLAARMAEHAAPGEVLVEEGVVVVLPRGTATFEAVGRVELRGLPMPVALWRASRPVRAPEPATGG
jgi:adenylate cyclase